MCVFLVRSCTLEDFLCQRPNIGWFTLRYGWSGQDKENTSDEGLVSQTNCLTLSKAASLKNRISKKVSSYAFVYLTQILAEIFQSVQSYDNVDYSDEDFVEDFSDSFRWPEFPSFLEEARKSVILLSGFAYFDDAFDCVGINVLLRQKSKQKLGFAGQFNVHTLVYYELQPMNHTQHLNLTNSNEVGFESFA